MLQFSEGKFTVFGAGSAPGREKWVTLPEAPVCFPARICVPEQGLGGAFFKGMMILDSIDGAQGSWRNHIGLPLPREEASG